MRRAAVAVAVLAILPFTSFAQGKRPLNADDLFSLKEVRDPQRSPDGKWVAYTVARAIRETDKNDTDVWMVSWDGQQQIQITSTPEGESSPRWSPDGIYLAFLSSRQGAKKAQVWLLNRAGGEAAKLTDLKGGVSEYAWSPDSKRLVLVVEDPDPSEADTDKEKDTKDSEPKTPKPIVVNRYQFKADVRGYLRGERPHLQLFDIAAKKAEPLTSGVFDEESPAWSPDGSQVAFIRRHGDGDVDKAPNHDLFVIEARAGAKEKRLTTTAADESGRLSWSPDGRSIACVLGDEPKYSAYDQNRLVTIAAAGGEPRILTDALDRPVRAPFWGADGSILVSVSDDRSEYIAKVPPTGGKVQKLVSGARVVKSFSARTEGGLAVIA